MVAPNTIDFSALFDNFGDRLLDSPYVLALLLTVLGLTVLGVVGLRRLDRRDSAAVSRAGMQTDLLESRVKVDRQPAGAREASSF